MQKFTFYPRHDRNDSVSITENPNATVGQAIQNAGEKLEDFSFSDNILFAEINEAVGEVAIRPSLLCMELKPNGKVQAKRRKGATPLPKDRRDPEKENKDPTTRPMLLFIKSNNAGIAKVPNTAYEGKLLCVDAHPEDTLMKAISKDGRFRKNFKLLEDTDAHSEVSLEYKVSKYSGQRFKMKKTDRKRKQSGDDETRYSKTRKQFVYSSMPSTIDAPFTQEIGKSMVEDARISALENLVKPGVEKAGLDNHLNRLVQKFGKVASSKIPARIMPVVTQAIKSVGLIKCGNCTGTCFLVADDWVITAQHVINNINTTRSESTDTERHRTISIYFNFLSQLELGEIDAEIDEKRLLFGEGKPDEKLDYVICGIEWVNPEMPKWEPLGPLVRSVLPHSGQVILVGHPNSEEKAIEICNILPSYNWHATLCKRAADAEEYCNEHPEECSIYSGENVRCVHIYKGRYLQGNHPDQLPYDTSFFEGSSGSPVFNSNGHIIAMHTQGYPFYKYKSSKEVSLMEFGVSFAAIYRDVKQQYSEDCAKFVFPNING